MKILKRPFFVLLWTTLPLALTGIAFSVFATDDDFGPIGRARHTIKHGVAFETELPTEARFTSSRKSNVVLQLPTKDDSFSFIIFGDRAAGQPEGLSILADAVYEANLIAPDFVITVGDMVQGYNEATEWLEQMREYKSIMNELKVPWFPVAGNHDMYWSPQNDDSVRPEREHEALYEEHFGPLWYAFEHKNCWFIVLFTDEGDSEGKKELSPEAQKMSDEQFQWLQSTLQKAKDAKHVFIFQHHPRWREGRYGNDWDRVHQLFVQAGNVRAVFAGHIHRMHYETKDGIEYFTLAVTGGNISANAKPEEGVLHHVNQVVVRDKQYGITAIPVRSLMDPRSIPRPVSCIQCHSPS